MGWDNSDYYPLSHHYYGTNPYYQPKVYVRPFNKSQSYNNNFETIKLNNKKPFYSAVKGINLEEYMKEPWYEIMYKGDETYDFEKGCNGAIANYFDLNENGNVFKVSNFCVEGNGKGFIQMGKAEILDQNEARLLVSFDQGLPKEVINIQRQMGGNYWIIDYKKGVYSVITGPDQKYAWILARNPIEFQQSDEYKNLKMKYSDLFKGAKERNVSIYENYTKKGSKFFYDQINQ